MSFTTAASSMAPENQPFAASAKIERPTAKPRQMACGAAMRKLWSSFSSLASRPSTSTPRQWASCWWITVAIFSQAAALAAGGSFHQSGKMPAW
jgi:hypothetical protein